MQVDELRRAALAFADANGTGDLPVPTRVHGFTVLCQRRPSELRAVLYEPVLCLVLQGAKRVFFGDRPVTFDQMQSAIISFELPTIAQVIRASPAEPYVALALRLDTTVLRETAAQMASLPGPGGAASPVATAAADAALVDAMARLFGLVDKPEAAAVLAPLVIREIHFWLLSARHGAMLRALTRADSHAARIATAIGHIRQDFKAPLRIADLARLAGMSNSAFHDHFKAMTGTTPLQYQKQLRLMEARRLIVDTGSPVSNAAFAVGYESPNQFSRDYARRFGTAPRDDPERGAHRSGAETSGSRRLGRQRANGHPGAAGERDGRAPT
ncbi:MAG TPA: AraC family transcriptional regulator [Kaistiaceae bacterium]|nr:AraC family transcriptional regulator [Kaistiaceae bacterium]